MRPWSARTDRERSQDDIASSKRIRWWLARILMRSAQMLSPEATVFPLATPIEAEPATREEESPFEVGAPPAHWVNRVRSGAPELLVRSDGEIARSNGEASSKSGFALEKAREFDRGHASRRLRVDQGYDLPPGNAVESVTSGNAAVVPERRGSIRRHAQQGDSLDLVGSAASEVPKVEVRDSQGSDQSPRHLLATTPVKIRSDESTAGTIASERPERYVKSRVAQSSISGFASQNPFAQRPDEAVIHTGPTRSDLLDTPSLPWSEEVDGGHVFSRARSVDQFPLLLQKDKQNVRRTTRVRTAAPLRVPAASASEAGSNTRRPVAASAAPTAGVFPPLATACSSRSPADATVVSAPLFAEDLDPWPELPELELYDPGVDYLRASEIERWRGVSGEQWGDR